MRLISARVRNYRIHEDLSVEFDPVRTLIGGANETGKSTLIEAVHRGLFLKSTVTGEAQRSMVSTQWTGYPEVSLRFLAKGAEYQLTKRFAGSSGTIRLVELEGTTWQGEEAESRLAALLGVDELGGGRGILGRLSEQWAHLWVWQGASGDDPARHANARQMDLIQQLQRVGGAVAIQSELDGRVVARFARATEEIFVRSGNARSGSDLEKAQTEARQAQADQAKASERLERLRQAVRDFDDASSALQRAASDLQALGRQRQLVDEKTSHAQDLGRIEQEQVSAVERAAEGLTTLEGIESSIEGLRDSIRTREESLKPQREKRESLQTSLAENRKRTSDAERHFDGALNRTREVRRRRDLAAAYVNRFEKGIRHEELLGRLGRAEGLESEIGGLREALAQLASIDQAGLEALQRLENQASQASAALHAMASEIEVLASDPPVRVGDFQASPGRRHRVTEPTEIKVGDAVCLRIHPGGGKGLAHAREELRRLREDLRRSLDEYGLESVAKAAGAVARRVELQSRLASAKAALAELGVGVLTQVWGTAKEELAAAEAEVERRLDQVPDAEQPARLAEAMTWREREEAALRSAESEEARARGSRDRLQQEGASLESELDDLRRLISESEQSLTGSEAQLRYLLDRHGDDGRRAGAIADARKAKQEAEAALAGTRASLEALQPHLLEANRRRLERAWKETEGRRQDALNALAVSQAALHSDGRVDPNSAFAHAEARLAAATERLEAVSRKAKAISLVDQLFQEEQRALADRFSQPLARRISGYLQCLFGPEARTVVKFEDKRFQGIELIRSGQEGALAFNHLSGGTREQVAAAVRLAVAELLSAAHEEVLPLVFDDSFAYSDPERVNMLQRMLDLAASRGLQIIVLSCNPSDYAALGARQVNLVPV